ncbi:hypothetical protein MNV49_005174 [Pseudohyphozyma bogoriensis]|nr:hypothetical protein MNV49_005174 [Pseudohyphozyma bogoriensis]
MGEDAVHQVLYDLQLYTEAVWPGEYGWNPETVSFKLNKKEPKPEDNRICGTYSENKFEWQRTEGIFFRFLFIYDSQSFVSP